MMQMLMHKSILSKGLNFVNGDNTVATVAADGKVSYDLNAATKTKIDESATAVARNISLVQIAVQHLANP